MNMNHVLCLILLLAATLFPGCMNPQTGEREVPWTAIDQELEFLIADMHSAQLVFTDPETQEALGRTAAALSHVEGALDAYLERGGPETKSELIAALQGALALAEGFLREDSPDGVKAILWLATSGLRRWEVYANPPPVPPVPPEPPPVPT
jgi:hypothetical protein